MRRAEAPLIFILDCRAPRIGSLSCDFGPEHPLALLWIVVVFCARAYVVCVWWMGVIIWVSSERKGGRGRVTYNRRGLGQKRSACSARRRGKARMRVIGGRRACSERHGRDKARVSVGTGVIFGRNKMRRDARKVVLVEEDVVVRWLARAEYPVVAQEVIVELDRAGDLGVDDQARGAVPALVYQARGGVTTLVVVGRAGDENYFVLFSNDDEGDLWVEVEFCACTYNQSRG